MELSNLELLEDLDTLRSLFTPKEILEMEDEILELVEDYERSLEGTTLGRNHEHTQTRMEIKKLRKLLVSAQVAVEGKEKKGGVL